MTIWQASPPVPLAERPQREERTHADTPELSRLKSALDAIPNSGTQELSYDEWRNVCFGIYQATQGSSAGNALAHAFSSRSSKYDPDFLDQRVWAYIRYDRDVAITERTIYSYAERYKNVADDFEIVVDVPHETSERFEFIPAREFMAGEPLPWIIKGVLPRAELIVIYGESQSGKTFFALDMAGAIATGSLWRERRVEQLRVGYIAAEGAGGFRNRLKAYESERGSVANIVVLADAPNFMEAKDVVDLGNAMRRASVQLVVVDTLAQVTPGANENAGEDMGRVIGHCRTLHAVTGATIVLIHHSGKDASKGARGWSGLRAAADAEIEITRCERDRVASITKLKDGEDGAEFGFTLDTVDVGKDRDGDTISSCVVKHGQAVPKARRVKLGDNEKLLLMAAQELVQIDGELPTVHEVFEAAKSQMAPAMSGNDRRGEALGRAWKSLTASKRLVAEGARVRVIAENDT